MASVAITLTVWVPLLIGGAFTLALADGPGKGTRYDSKLIPSKTISICVTLLGSVAVAEIVTSFRIRVESVGDVMCPLP